MKKFKKHKLLWILICVLLALIIIIGVSFARNGGTDPVSEGAQSAVNTVEKPVSSATGGISVFFRGIFQFKELETENDELRAEIDALKEKNRKLTLEKEQYEELKELEQIFDVDSITEQKTVGADVVSVDSSNWMSVFTISRGTESGIKVDDVVVDANGLAGRVIDAGKGWAKVSSVFEEANNISFRVYRDRKLVGIASGDGKEGMKGYMLDNSAGIIEGDTIITSGIGIYPKGIEIGKITKVELNRDTQYKEVTIKPAASVKSLQKVAVII